MSSSNGSEKKAILLPFYVVVDVSHSMVTENFEDGLWPLDRVNNIVPEVVDALREEPTAADKVRIGLIDFSGEAKLRLPLSDARDLTGADMPKLTSRLTGTLFSNAFLKIRETIEADAAQLQANGFDVHRPAVFFLTDGVPTETDADWEEAFAILTSRDFELHPNFIPYGFAEASRATLDQLADFKTGHDSGRPSGFISKDKSAAAAVTGMINTLVSSVIATGLDLASNGIEGEFVLAVPEEEDQDDDFS
ncbi:VWA domain-containing protein [Pseudarthrobacter sp. NPDC080039]|uniref:vWA domain-containing protein n=1 Tax=unclassified Pseudarthrobacter TaxID=2647000 RepID=UPI00344BAA88